MSVNFIISGQMNKFRKETLKVRLLKLAALKCTGAPADLAIRFEISERHVKRIVKEMRDNGTKIWYCQTRRSYVTEEEYQ
jgi:hypothetical protein